MKISEVLKDPTILKNNYKNLIKDLEPEKFPSETIHEKVLLMPTTHSFGYQKVFKLEETSDLTEVVYPYQKILFDDKSFLSDAYRSAHNKFKKSEPKRTMSKAREYGLDEFVFTYLGSHEYYYSQTKGMNTPAFGVFFDHRLEKTMEDSNATLYDLESKMADFYTPTEMTLYPGDARTLTSYETEKIYDSDFFNYWIGKNYKANKFHMGGTWDQKREFHYKDLIPVNNIKAILWPMRTIYNGRNKTLTLDSSMIEDYWKFVSNNLENKIKLYLYIWVANQGVSRFAYASYLVSKSIFETGDFPDEQQFYNDFKNQFPKPAF